MALTDFSAYSTQAVFSWSLGTLIKLGKGTFTFNPKIPSENKEQVRLKHLNLDDCVQACPQRAA